MQQNKNMNCDIKKKSTATSGENLLQYLEKAITTSQALLMQHQKKRLLQQKKSTATSRENLLQQ